jgi:hypothetical protein
MCQGVGSRMMQPHHLKPPARLPVVLFLLREVCWSNAERVLKPPVLSRTLVFWQQAPPVACCVVWLLEPPSHARVLHAWYH